MKKKDINSGIYLLPNLLTTASLFAAFYSIVSSLKGSYEASAVAIFVGMIADGLDGRIARLTNTQTNFGAEYDSLSDMVTFGVAPALLLYSWGLNELGKFGWLVAFMYTAAVALRLARFNTQIEVADKSYFQGLACPAGAGLILAYIWLCAEQNSMIIIAIAAILAIFTSVLMVSNVRYYSFKEIDSTSKVPFLYILIMVIIFVAIALNPAIVILIGGIIYALSGPMQTLISLQKMHREKRRKRKSEKNKQQ